MFESKVMAAFITSRADFDMVHAHVDRDKLSPLGVVLLDTISEYYDKDMAADHVDVEVLHLALDRRFEGIPRHQAKMRDFMVEVLSSDTSSTNVMNEVLEQKRALQGNLLADALLSQDQERIGEAMLEYLVHHISGRGVGG